MTLAPRLLPRLLPRDAAARFDEVSLDVYGEGRDVRDAIGRIGSEVRADDAGMVYTAVGPGRVTESELWTLRESIVEAANSHGFPEPFPAVDAGRAFDDAITPVLLNETGLFPAEAAVYEIWSYLALILLPDVTAWRAPPDARNRSKHEKGVNPERYIGADLTRHTWSRLWWRGYLITNGVEESGRALELLFSLNEADRDQIFTRREAWGASSKMCRALIAFWESRRTVEPLAGLQNQRDVLRELLKHLLRRGAFISFEVLDEAQLEAAFDRALNAIPDVHVALHPPIEPHAEDSHLDTQPSASDDAGGNGDIPPGSRVEVLRDAFETSAESGAPAVLTVSDALRLIAFAGDDALMVEFTNPLANDGIPPIPAADSDVLLKQLGIERGIHCLEWELKPDSGSAALLVERALEDVFSTPADIELRID